MIDTLEKLERRAFAIAVSQKIVEKFDLSNPTRLGEMMILEIEKGLEQWEAKKP